MAVVPVSAITHFGDILRITQAQSLRRRIALASTFVRPAPLWRDVHACLFALPYRYDVWHLDEIDDPPPWLLPAAAIVALGIAVPTGRKNSVQFNDTAQVVRIVVAYIKANLHCYERELLLSRVQQYAKWTGIRVVREILVQFAIYLRARG